MYLYRREETDGERLEELHKRSRNCLLTLVELLEKLILEAKQFIKFMSEAGHI